MKKILSLLLVSMASFGSMQALAQSQQKPTEKDSYVKPYHPEANAMHDIDSLLQVAKKEQKNIILQAGGNWCIWCLRFNNYIQSNAAVKSVVSSNFLYYHLNYSPENKNEAVFQRYAPEGNKLGYPFFIVLDKSGKVLKVQDSGSLEAGKGYDEEKVLSFFNTWK